MSGALRFENQSISRVEARYMQIEAGKSYIACEDLDFLWSKDEVKEFQQLWNEGYSIVEIAGFFKRAQEEVAILILDQAMKGKIKPRRGGLLSELAQVA